MIEFFRMGGYGTYVWSAYALFAVVLLVDALTPIWQRRNTLQHIATRLRRESARGGATNSRPSGARNENP